MSAEEVKAAITGTASSSYAAAAGIIPADFDTILRQITDALRDLAQGDVQGLIALTAYAGFDPVAQAKLVLKYLQTGDKNKAARFLGIVIAFGVQHGGSWTERRMTSLPPARRDLIRQAFDHYHVKKNKADIANSDAETTVARIMALLYDVVIRYRYMYGHPAAGIAIQFNLVGGGAVLIKDPAFCSTEGIYLCQTKNRQLMYMEWAKYHNVVINRRAPRDFDDTAIIAKTLDPRFTASPIVLEKALEAQLTEIESKGWVNTRQVNMARSTS